MSGRYEGETGIRHYNEAKFFYKIARNGGNKSIESYIRKKLKKSLPKISVTFDHGALIVIMPVTEFYRFEETLSTELKITQTELNYRNIERKKWTASRGRSEAKKDIRNGKIKLYIDNGFLVNPVIIPKKYNEYRKRFPIGMGLESCLYLKSYNETILEHLE